MTLYNVHIYREMRLFFPGIEAATPEEAATKARDLDTADADDVTSCDGETLAALVDVTGDDQHERSVMIDFEGERLRKAAPLLLEALQECIKAINAYAGVMTDEIAATLANAKWSAQAAISKATGQEEAAPRPPIIIEVRGGVVQNVLIPPGIDYEFRDYDNQD